MRPSALKVIERPDDMQYTWLNILVLVPVALMLFGSVVLWRRKHLPATVLITAGFAMYFVGYLAGYATGAWFRIWSESTYAISLATHGASVLGEWIAGAGLVWYALSSNTTAITNGKNNSLQSHQ